MRAPLRKARNLGSETKGLRNVLAKANLLFAGMYYSPFTKIRDCEPERKAFRLAIYGYRVFDDLFAFYSLYGFILKFPF